MTAGTTSAAAKRTKLEGLADMTADYGEVHKIDVTEQLIISEKQILELDAEHSRTPQPEPGSHQAAAAAQTLDLKARTRARLRIASKVGKIYASAKGLEAASQDWIMREGYKVWSDKEIAKSKSVRGFGVMTQAIFAPYLSHLRVPQYVIANLEQGIKQRERAAIPYLQEEQTCRDPSFKQTLRRENNGHAFFRDTERKIVEILKANNLRGDGSN